MTDTLQHLWEERSMFYGEEHAEMDEMVLTYFGGIPDEFKDYFPDDMHTHLINMIRVAWDDLASMTGKVFPLYVRPDNSTPTAKERAEKQEMIGYGYNDAGSSAGGISMELLMKVFAWWLVGCANAVGMVLPSYDRQTPYFTFRDPRTFYPPVGWSPYTQAAPSDGMFAYSMSIKELIARYPDKEAELREKHTGTTTGPGSQTSRKDYENTFLWVCEYYRPEYWTVETLFEKPVILQRSEEGDYGHPGIVPSQQMSLYTPLGSKGRSLFSDQVSIQAAMARMFSQKIEYFDRSLYPVIFHTGLTGGAVKVGPYATAEFADRPGSTPKVEVVGPTQSVDADKMMAFALGMSRMLNRNPEMMQGAGQADSAKALTELRSGITATVRDWLWPPMLEGLKQMYWKAAQLDLNVWPNIRKKAEGRRRNASFRVSYLPAVDLVNHTQDFRLEPGLGLAGYQGTVEILQLLGAEQISQDTALEQLEHGEEPQEEKRRIFNDKLEKILFALLAAKATQGMVKMSAIHEIRKQTNEGKDPYEVMKDLEAAGALYEQPVAPEGTPGPAPAMGQAGPTAMAPDMGRLRERIMARG